jgi:hypothetical protein
MSPELVLVLFYEDDECPVRKINKKLRLVPKEGYVTLKSNFDVA